MPIPNMPIPKDATTSDLYNFAQDIRTQAEADAFFEMLVEYGMSYGQSREEAERIQRSNLGYWTGYCSKEVAERMMRLFKCEHPYFGTRLDVTPDEAFAKGMEMGKKWKAELDKKT